MKKIVCAIILALIATGYAAIVKVSLPRTISASTSPKTVWIDENDQALRNGVNQAIDTVNRLRDTTNKYLYKRSFTGSGSLVYATSPTLDNAILDTIVGVDGNIYVKTNDTLNAGYSRFDVSNIGTSAIGFANITDGLVTDMDFATFSATSGFIGSMTGTTIATTGRITGSDIDVSDSVKGVTISATGRITGSDIDVSDSVKGVTIAGTSIIENGTNISSKYAQLSGADFTGQVSTTSSSYPVFQSTRTTSGTSVVSGVSSTKLKSSGDVTDGFGPGHAFVIEDNAGVATTMAMIFGIRNGADNTGKLRLSAYSAGTPYNVVEISEKLLAVSGLITTDSIKPYAKYNRIRTISSTGTVALDRQYSFVYHTAASGNLTLPDATGSGLEIEIFADNAITIAPAGGDSWSKLPCSPTASLPLGATGACSSSITTGPSVKVIDCATDKWCYTGWDTK